MMVLRPARECPLEEALGQFRLSFADVRAEAPGEAGGWTVAVPEAPQQRLEPPLEALGGHDDARPRRLGRSRFDAVGAMQVPFGSLATWISLIESLFSSAKAKPTQPSALGDPSTPAMIALSFALATGGPR